MLKKISFLMLLLIISNNAFSMEIIKGKKYKNLKNDQIVIIEGSCKELFDVEGLVKVGRFLNLPNILEYLEECSRESDNEELLISLTIGRKVASAMITGDYRLLEDAIKRCVDEKYHGIFYEVRDETSPLNRCVHESWLTPVEEDTN